MFHISVDISSSDSRSWAKGPGESDCEGFDVHGTAGGWENERK